MSDHIAPLPAGRAGEAAQIAPSAPEIVFRDRLFLLFTLCFCVLLADAFFWHGPTASLGIAVAAWVCCWAATWPAGSVWPQESGAASL